MGERGEEGIMRPAENGNGERGARLLPRPVLPFHDRASKLAKKTPLFGLLAKEGAILQSRMPEVVTEGKVVS